MQNTNGGVTAAKGFKAACCAAEIKYKNRTDMAMVYSDVPCECAGTFTSNVVKAACVQWDQKIVYSGKPMQAVVCNSGIANACTGQEGWDACESTAKAVEAELGVDFETVAVASTGVIGMQLPVEKLVNGVSAMSKTLSDSIEAGTAASKAIMTTDTINKEIAVTFDIDGKTVTLGGMSKGSVKDTFNMITVDGDTSTNDTLLIMANGLAENTKITEKGEAYNEFYDALFYVCRFLARTMAGDGEGATKLFEAKVINAKSKDDARTLSRAIVGSNLSKAAIYGCDANFGRFLCAMGYSGAQFDQNDVELFFESDAGRMQVFDHGTPLTFDEEQAKRILAANEVTVFVDMHEGEAEATAWGCDLTYDYVKINADYRS